MKLMPYEIFKNANYFKGKNVLKPICSTILVDNLAAASNNQPTLVSFS